MATFTNQDTLSYNNTTTTSNIVTGELIEVLTANKTAVPISYRISDTVTFIINLINSGGTALNGTSISSDLGTYTTSALVSVTPLTQVEGSVRYYSNGILQTTPTVAAGPPLVISNITVPANGNATIIYQAVVNNYAPPATNGTITDTSTITNAALFNDVVVAASIIAEASADLSITKSISPEAVVENGQITYTFTIQNTGNTAAVVADNVVVTDTFNPILTLICSDCILCFL